VEAWRTIPSFDAHYQISNEGRIRRIRILSPAIVSGGYLAVTLGRRPHRKTTTLHRLVALAFLGPAPQDHQINHKNGKKRDNRVENLEWVTRKQNAEHATRVLRVWTGERNGRAVLTRTQVVSARKMRAHGCLLKDIAARYGVTPQAIYRICKRLTWNHL